MSTRRRFVKKKLDKENVKHGLRLRLGVIV